MHKLLEGSLLYQWLTAAAEFIDRQWQKSCLALLIAGAGERTESSSVFARLGAWLHRLLFRIFKALRLDRVFEGSIIARTFFWCALAAFIAPIAPTMVSLGVVLVGFGSLVIRLGTHEGAGLLYAPVRKWILLYAFVYLVCTFTSVTLAGSLKSGVLTLAFILFSVALMSSVDRRSQVDTLIFLLIAAGLLVSLYGFYQVITGVESTTDWIDEDTFSSLKLRVYSTLGNPNVLGEYLLLIIPLGVVSIFTAKTAYGKSFSVVSTAAMLGAMVLTYSRGGWLGLIFSAAVFLVITDRRFIVLGMIAFVALLFVLPESIMSRFSSITDMSDSSTSYRIYIWMATVNMLKDYWFCGVGTGMAAYAAVYPKYSFNAVSAPHSHNLYLQIMCESGICGIALFLALIASFFRMTASALAHAEDQKTRLQLTAVIAGMAGFLLQGMTDYSFYNYRVTLVFWVYIAVAALLARRWEGKA